MFVVRNIFHEILWRQKEQFSDGVGYNWIDGLKEFIDTRISEEEFNSSPNNDGIERKRYSKTREALYYRRIFDNLFPNRTDIVPMGFQELTGMEFHTTQLAQLFTTTQFK